MAKEITESELEAYLDEALAPEDMAGVENELRENRELVSRLAVINRRRDAGIHSLGEIWRRHRISCPTREHLGSYLLGALDEAHMEYIAFHIEKVGCRYCIANVEDLRRRQAESSETTTTRRRKYFESSAGYLKSDRERE